MHPPARALQAQDQIALTELVDAHPMELGLAELVAYLSIASEDSNSVIDDSARTTIAWRDAEGMTRRAIMPSVIFVRPLGDAADTTRDLP